MRIAEYKQITPENQNQKPNLNYDENYQLFLDKIYELIKSFSDKMNPFQDKLSIQLISLQC